MDATLIIKAADMAGVTPGATGTARTDRHQPAGEASWHSPPFLLKIAHILSGARARSQATPAERYLDRARPELTRQHPDLLYHPDLTHWEDENQVTRPCSGKGSRPERRRDRAAPHVSNDRRMQGQSPKRPSRNPEEDARPRCGRRRAACARSDDGEPARRSAKASRPGWR